MNPPYSKITGGDNLRGNVSISGSKNASLPIIAAAMLTGDTCVLHNVPNLTDVSNMFKALQSLGANVINLGNNSWSITAQNIKTDARNEIVQRLRASICLLGSILGRKNQVTLSMPGGCKLGTRPIDLHLKAFQVLGSSIECNEKYVHIEAKNLIGSNISMQGPKGPSMTGTSNAIMASVLAKKITVINHASREPEIAYLCEFLNKMGADISGISTDTLTIKGVEELHGTEFTIPPDRIETGTFIILGYLCGNSIRINGISEEFLKLNFEGFFESIPNSSQYCNFEDNVLVVNKIQNLQPFKVDTMPYPGFPTDLQALTTVLASQGNGTSYIRDNIFPERFAHIEEFQRLGMHIEKNKGEITITQKSQLHGCEVATTDLRAGAALYLAGLIASSETIVTNLEYIDRGYENFEQKLQSLGANIQRFYA